MMKSMHHGRQVTVVAALFALAGAAGARTWYVHPDSALATVQAGLDSCAPGDTVLVAAGTYVETVEWPMTGNITLASESGSDSTTIYGDDLAPGPVLYIFALEDSCATIRGFTIRNGNTAGGGGGISVDMASVSVIDCRVYDNFARLGGGMAFTYGTVLVRRCVVEENESGLYPPGGIDIGPGCTALIDSSTITANWPDGVSFTDGAATVIRHCNIVGNYGYGVSFSGSPFDSVLAEHNWWGAASGPYHPVANPAGQGDTVSDHVDFTPWLGDPVRLGTEERTNAEVRRTNGTATLVRGLLRLPEEPGVVRRASSVLLDALGRRVMVLAAGANDVGHLAPGVYFVRDGAEVRPVLLVR